jgi:predicted negative regulator of RcsB-dependent stress response
VKAFFKEVWKWIAGIAAIVVGGIVGYQLVKKHRAEVIQKATKRVEILAPGLGVEEYREKVHQAAVDIGRAEVQEVIDEFTKRFGG